MRAITVRDGEQFYRVVNPTPAWVAKHDNGRTVSCGLTVGEDGLTRHEWMKTVRRFEIETISKDDWNHSGCQSSCVRRGAQECRW